MAISWNTVTWYSKALAIVLFVGIAVGAFYLGREYERVMGALANSEMEQSQTLDHEGSMEATEEEYAMRKNGDLIIRARNMAYVIENQSVKLRDGFSHVAQDNTASWIETEYFGNEAVGDTNQDGKNDMVFVITQRTGGTGAFFYAVALVSQGNEYQGTNGVFMGDRIAPQSTDIRDGVANVNYADRAPNEPMITQPSIGKTLRLVIKDGRLVKQ